LSPRLFYTVLPVAFNTRHYRRLMTGLGIVFNRLLRE
jgi:hypothetical protein